MKTEKEYVKLDSNKYGTLYARIQSDSLLYMNKFRKSHDVYFGRANSVYSNKLIKKSIVSLIPNYLRIYTPETGVIDTLYHSSKISSYDFVLVHADSIIGCYKDEIVIFNVNSGKAIYERSGTFFYHNLVFKDQKAYILFGSKQNKVELIHLDLKTGETSMTYIFDGENWPITEYDHNWTGAYEKNNILFIQFQRKLVAFDILENRILDSCDKLTFKTTFVNATPNYIKFKVEGFNEFWKFDFKSRKFVQ